MATVSRVEQETIINFNEEEPTAEIFTYSKVWQRHLEKKLGLKPISRNGWGAKIYEIDKKRIRPPMPKKHISPENRAKLIARLSKSRDSQKSSRDTQKAKKSSSA